MPKMTKEQFDAVANCIIFFSKMYSETPPSLDENVERLRDHAATTVGTIYLSVGLIFGNEERDNLREALGKALCEMLGAGHHMTPRVLNEGAETGVFKKWLAGQYKWEPPTA